MKKILVANRGEIALRIMRSIREMGIKTVAVYSEADRNSPHVRFADEAVCLGAPPSSQSYLQADRIIDFALQLGVDGIHPGFGFLSENAIFAQKVTDAGITFIGPTPSAIETMGDKLAAKQTVSTYNIPMVPGTNTAIHDLDEAKRIAVEVGFPVLIKAAAGGGGKGMRIVENMEELDEQMQRAISEAVAAFGNGAVFIERYVTSPRHVEIQVLADMHGNIVYLFERECSIQRRHQKVIEEAPSAILTPEMRAQMGKSATDVARSCNYVGAGTVEFLVDDKMNYYFLEMNTRLQVEHSVTEWITGVDLVKEQVRVAMGQPLSFTQDDLHINGHALELRVYAEDPCNNFLPDIGTLSVYRAPQGLGIRVDDGFEEGMSIPIYYDPMISKLSVHAATRAEAIERMKQAIDEYHIVGVENTLKFGRWAMEQPSFVTGNYNTHFVKEHFKPEYLQKYDATEAQVAALIAVKVFGQQQNKSGANNSPTVVTKQKRSNWKLRV
ncbi:MAG: acetyl-CoA carboxylase biotin carboxylase subunit [Chitinophagales bacterium]|nr:acetyl-CoA carboxylase biotin carboxylase subunit [Chitinophagales bacterium]